MGDIYYGQYLKTGTFTDGKPDYREISNPWDLTWDSDGNKWRFQDSNEPKPPGLYDLVQVTGTPDVTELNEILEATDGWIYLSLTPQPCNAEQGQCPTGENIIFNFYSIFVSFYVMYTPRLCCREVAIWVTK